MSGYECCSLHAELTQEGSRNEEDTSGDGVAIANAKPQSLVHAGNADETEVATVWCTTMLVASRLLYDGD